ncbi:hypothetical protein BDR26DRAFT_197381 [Obelidium mucronatum]|nr:hypothetical protein BDR26DRAFT_197381 [Obelidium mucronatum]
MVSQVIQQENSGHAQSPQQQQQQQQQQQDSNNPPGFEEMKRVTKSLYDWSQNMINAPINLFDNKNLPQITPNTIMPPQARNNTPPKSSSNLNDNNSLPAPQQLQQQQQQGSSLSPETAAASAQNLQQPSSSNNISQPNDPTSLSPSGNPAASQQTLLADSQQQPAAPAQQETIYGEFDVLLNACKPVAAESKLSIRLNVMQETNPPQALIKSLKENLGYDIKTHVETIKVEEVEHSIRGFSFAFPANKSTDAATAAAATLSNKRRHQYGNWYIKPSMWNEYMVKSGAEKNPKPREKMGGLVQQKLDAIMVNRAKEEAAFQAALLQSFGPPPPPPTAAPVQQGQGQQGAGTTAHSRGSRVDADASAAAAAAGGGGGGFAGISRQVSRQVSRQASRQSSFANLLQQEGGGGVGGGGGAPGKSAGGRSLSTLKREQSKSQASIASVPE